jgi:aminopeptidase YwaD
MSFYMKNIPVLFFITGLHKDYHTPSDVISAVNFEGMTDISIFLMNLLLHIDNVQDMPFIEGEKKESLVDRSYTRGVTLGVIPDHTFGGKGMRIDDVFKGRPADQSGLKAGDIIVAIDEHDVSDISTYMKALSNFRTGLKANIKIIRGTEEHTFEVTF